MPAARPDKPEPVAAADIRTLERLNREYVRSVDSKDVGWFDRYLAADFLNSNPDGTLLDRTAFLAQIARGAGVSRLEARDVVVRCFGDFAVIHAQTRYQRADGNEGRGRYTDIWRRHDGNWTCIAAHVTRG